MKRHFYVEVATYDLRIRAGQYRYKNSLCISGNGDSPAEDNRFAISNFKPLRECSFDIILKKLNGYGEILCARQISNKLIEMLIFPVFWILSGRI